MFNENNELELFSRDDEETYYQELENIEPWENRS
jgi:hypothetical protein